MSDSPIVRVVKISGKALLGVTVPVMVCSPPAALACGWTKGERVELVESLPLQGQEPGEAKHAPGFLTSAPSLTSGTSVGFTLQVAVANPLAELLIIEKGVRTVEEQFRDKLTPVQVAGQVVPPTNSVFKLA